MKYKYLPCLKTTKSVHIIAYNVATENCEENCNVRNILLHVLLFEQSIKRTH